MPRTNVGAAAKTSPRRIKSTERTLAALELRKKGLSYSQIGKELQVRPSTAYRYVVSELANLADVCLEEAAVIRDIELQRLDDLYQIAWVEANAGNVAAIDRCLRVMERRAKLLGLDAPEKIDHGGDIQIVLHSVDMGAPADE